MLSSPELAEFKKKMAQAEKANWTNNTLLLLLFIVIYH